MVDPPQTLHILALGPPEVHMGEHLLAFPTRKTLAMLIYLAIEPGLHPREHLAALLWPESTPERSHANLRNTLSHLQKVLVLHQVKDKDQIAYLSITHHALGLDTDTNINFDLHTVEHAFELAR